MKYTTKKIHTVDYDEFDKFVDNIYGGNYEFVADHESRNDTSHSFYVEKKPLDDYEQKQIDTYKTTHNGFFMAQIFLQDAVNNDLIPEGEWLIDIYW